MAKFKGSEEGYTKAFVPGYGPVVIGRGTADVSDKDAVAALRGYRSVDEVKPAKKKD